MPTQETGEVLGKFLVFGLLAIMGAGGGIFFVVSLIQAIRRKTKGWIIACVAAGCIAIAGVLGGIGLAAKSFVEKWQESTMAGGEKKTLRSSDGGASVEVPKGWISKPDIHQEASIGASDLLEQVFLLVLTDSKEDFAGSLADFDEVTVGNMEKVIAGAEISDAEPKWIGGNPALYRRLSGRVDHVNIVYHRVSVETADAYHQVMVWTTASRESAGLPLALEVLESFRTTAGPPQAETSEPE